jgi:hypothetical protein
LAGGASSEFLVGAVDAIPFGELASIQAGMTDFVPWAASAVGVVAVNVVVVPHRPNDNHR